MTKIAGYILIFLLVVVAAGAATTKLFVDQKPAEVSQTQIENMDKLFSICMDNPFAAAIILKKSYHINDTDKSDGVFNATVTAYTFFALPLLTYEINEISGLSMKNCNLL